MENKYSEFQSLLDALVDLGQRKSSRANSFNTYLNNKSRAIFKKYFPKKKKYDFNLIKDTPEYQEYKVMVEKVGNKFWDFWNIKTKEIEDKLWNLAQELTPPKSNEFILWKTGSSYSFGSQGYGASKYAQNQAEGYADKAKFNDLEVEIRVIDNGHDNKYGIQYNDYQVWVKTNELGLKILDYGKDVSLVEAVRLMLKRGYNPFVRMPFLPQNFLESNKLNWFGEFLK